MAGDAEELTNTEKMALNWHLLCQRYGKDPLSSWATEFEPRQGDSEAPKGRAGGALEGREVLETDEDLEAADFGTLILSEQGGIFEKIFYAEDGERHLQPGWLEVSTRERMRSSDIALSVLVLARPGLVEQVFRR